jgi:hypothetical protein
MKTSFNFFNLPAGSLHLTKDELTMAVPQAILQTVWFEVRKLEDPNGDSSIPVTYELRYRSMHNDNDMVQLKGYVDYIKTQGF